MRALVVVSISLASCFATVTSTQVHATRQQGVLSFRVTNPQRCQLTVYRDASLTEKVEDTNNALFPGSESCDRPYNIVDSVRIANYPYTLGLPVTAVIGRRTSERASDGKLHSRSLEVVHTYYAKIVDSLDGGTTIVSFATDNIPWGDTHVEVPPFDSTAFGQWAYPDLDWSDAGLNKLYVDPLSGLPFKRIPRQMQGHGGLWEGNSPYSEFPFGGALDVRGQWGSPQNALTTSLAGPFATYSGGTQAPLVMFFKGRNADGSPVRATTPFDVFSLWEDVQANLYAAAATTGNAEDTKVMVCLVVNYNPLTDRCASPEIEVALPPSPAKISKPDSYPSWQLAGWNVGRYLTQREAGIFGGQTGTANVTNSSVTLGISYDTDTMLSPDAVPGMKVNIGGSWYTIATISSASRFTLVEPNVTIAGAYWYMGNFGVRIRKKTTASNTITLAATYSIAWSTPPSVSAGSAPSWCNLNTFPLSYDADGVTRIAPKTARLCMLGDYDVRFVYLLADDGEMRYISPLSHIDITTVLGAWSSTDPYSLYGYGRDDTSSSDSSIYEIKYDITCGFKQWPGNAFNLTPSTPDCMTWTNKTPHSQGRSVTQQIAAAIPSNPIWDPSFPVGTFRLGVVINKYAVLAAGLHDGVCWVAIFDLSTYSLIKILDSFSGTWGGLTFAACHSGGGTNLTNWVDYVSFTAVQLAGQQQHTYLAGPFILPDGAINAKSLDGGATWDNDTSLTNVQAGQCGSNAFGVSGVQCVKLRISTDEVCSSNFSGPDVARWPCSWQPGWTAGPLRIGENTYISQRKGFSVDGKAEKFRILSKVPDSRGWIIEVQRWATCDNPTSDPHGSPPACLYYDHLYSGVSNNIHAAGWNAYVSPTWASSGVDVWYNLPGVKTTATPDTSIVSGNHTAAGMAPDNIRTLQVGYGGPMASRAGILPDAISKPPDHLFEIDKASFAGITRASGTAQVEEYPALVNQRVATAAERGLVFNFRHINPESGYFPEKLGVGVWYHTYTLVAGTQYTYKVNIYQDIGNQKEWRPSVVSAGGIWRDISGPEASIDDSKSWTFCYTYKASECRPGAVAGDLYVVARNAHMDFGQCIIGTLKLFTPCVTNLWSYAGWVEQRDTQRDDPTGNHFRRLTMGLVGPTAQYMYNTAHPTPDHTWMFIRSSWVNGVRPDALAYKIPPAPESDDGVDRTNYIPVTVAVPAGSGFVRARFGYAENGSVSDFYCTTRLESCLTDSQKAPFAFEYTDTPSAPLDCRNGCTLMIPALSGRVLYYRIEKAKAASGSPWVRGSTQVIAVL